MRKRCPLEIYLEEEVIKELKEIFNGVQVEEEEPVTECEGQGESVDYEKESEGDDSRENEERGENKEKSRRESNNTNQENGEKCNEIESTRNEKSLITRYVIRYTKNRATEREINRLESVSRI